jgi:methionyl-tRNA formyltransferase
MRILQTLVARETATDGKKAFYVRDGKAYAACGQGVLRVVRFELGGIAMNAAEFAARFGTQKFEFNC